MDAVRMVEACSRPRLSIVRQSQLTDDDIEVRADGGTLDNIVEPDEDSCVMAIQLERDNVCAQAFGDDLPDNFRWVR